VYCPDELMLPAPAEGSPPLNDQVTASGSPLEAVTENLCTGVPWTLIPLQPVQFVSITPDLGATANVGLAV